VTAEAPARAVAPAEPAAKAPPARSAISPARAALEAARNMKRGGAPAAAQPAAAPAAVAPMPMPAPQPRQAESDMPPPWDDIPVFDDDMEPAQKKTEVVVDEPAAPIIAVAQPVELPPAPPPMPVAALDWDGDWPVLAATLPVRGVVHQLAQQSELLECVQEGNTFLFKLRVPIGTLCSSATVDKLAAALEERFGKPARVTTEIGAARQTANAKAVAEREARQLQAEETMHSDPFIQTLKREFGAIIVPGSIKPV
jgi:DNA polymerase-3 subunit gamma/tau